MIAFKEDLLLIGIELAKGPRYRLTEGESPEREQSKIMNMSRYRGYEPGPFSCRRRANRRRINPVSATCWTDAKSPSPATVIEADTKGARIVLPWKVTKGDTIAVSYGNHLGLYRTEKAKIAWTQQLDTGKTIVGLYYESACANAA